MEFEISPTTLSTILKNKNKIEEARSSSIAHGKFRKARFCEYADVDKAMIKWVTAARHKNIPLSGPIIREKAIEFAESLGHSDFIASVGWLDKFKRRHNIAGRVVCGESGDINIQTRNDWINNVLPNIIEQYDHNDIFNADETGLFYKCLPSRTLAFKNEKCVGGKKSKDRITVMVGSNMTGTEKLKLLVIGKAKNPRCFKGLQNLGVDYESNQKSWMTTDLYEKWLISLDKKFAAQKRKILLFVDNCPAHSKSVQNRLKNINLVFFPPNMTSSLQPMDQGIIQNLKHHYRKRILQKILNYNANEDPVAIDLLAAVRNLTRAWNSDVKSGTIHNCFKKAGFPINSTETADIVDQNNSHLSELWLEYANSNNIEGVAVEDYVNVDCDTITMECPSDEDILQSILSSHYEVNGVLVFLKEKYKLYINKPNFLSESDDEESDIEQNVSELPSFSQVHSSFNTIRTFLESRNNVPGDIFCLLNRCEDFVDEEKWKHQKQMKITSFFNTI